MENVLSLICLTGEKFHGFEEAARLVCRKSTDFEFVARRSSWSTRAPRWMRNVRRTAKAVRMVRPMRLPETVPAIDATLGLDSVVERVVRGDVDVVDEGVDVMGRAEVVIAAIKTKVRLEIEYMVICN